MNRSCPIDLKAIREKLHGARGKEWWQGLDEVAETSEYKNFLHREFQVGGSELDGVFNRREFVKLAAASLALAGVTGCTRQPAQAIVPYVRQPEHLVPGKSLYFATAMPFNGYGQGILVESHEGHPTKIEGNPDHPITLGASSSFMQAAILDLYDPDRSRAIMNAGQPASWENFLSSLNEALAQQAPKKGASLRILTETITSPTLSAQLDSVLKKFPSARWHQYQSINRDAIHEGARLAFGEVVAPFYHFEKARVILSLDSDFMLTEPAAVHYIQKFADRRRSGRITNRLYVAESSPTLTGTNADHRLPAPSHDILILAVTLAAKLGIKVTTNNLPISPHDQWISIVAADLERHPGECLIIAGENQPASVHALAHAMNEKLGNFGNTVTFIPSAETPPNRQLASIQELVRDLHSGKIDLLIMLGGNPVYTVPSDLEFFHALQKAKLRIHSSLYNDETSAFCHWHIPQTHFLETWSDLRAYDGTVTIMQPLIDPLYDGKSDHQILEAITQEPVRESYEIVRNYWKAQHDEAGFEKAWRRALHDGVAANSRFISKTVKVKDIASIAFQESSPSREKTSSHLELNFRPDPTIWDGRFANNGWLQELVKPATKLTWDNAALLSPQLAEKTRLQNGDIVSIQVDGRELRAATWITPGQAEHSITLHLGYGRSRSGNVGTDLGFNANTLRTTDHFWSTTGIQLTRIGLHYPLASTQLHNAIESTGGRGILFEGTTQEFSGNENLIQQQIEKPKANETLYTPQEHQSDDYRWGMLIDLNTCIGCNACTSACYAENNIPVVGKDQVLRGRELYWIRVDTYLRGGLDHPQFTHQPVPCMHCENAPCELVCPVAATVHDHEGLNLQVYNRCVGTRYCSNNCPYKVRRFNFLQYADYKTESLKPMRNPNVTVRSRGVMEKCTYCVQRISAARITAKNENRQIRDGEIKTACQQACPAHAIVFGDLSDPGSNVSKLKNHLLNFDMLAALNTRPRTSYLAKLRNPNPEMESFEKSMNHPMTQTDT